MTHVTIIAEIRALDLDEHTAKLRRDSGEEYAVGVWDEGALASMAAAMAPGMQAIVTLATNPETVAKHGLNGCDVVRCEHERKAS